MLVGGSVVNTGSLAAPAGGILVQAVPETGRIRLSLPGQVLSLEVLPPRDAAGNVQPFSALDIPALVTGSAHHQIATGLSATPEGVTLDAAGLKLPTEPGTAIVSGALDAAGTTGGDIAVLGEVVGLVAAAVDASGEQGGGNIRIGGNFQGNGSLPNAARTYVDRDSQISANAEVVGDGGEVIVWADDVTAFYGDLSARGGAASGDGGFVEISGKESLAFDGRVDTSAPNGSSGTVLFDPRDIIIGSGAGNNSDLVPGVDQSILFDDGGLTDFFTRKQRL
ncbi:MAG: hypothetical protein HC910_22975 [Spirulinaceae cyanobacterium SM2_1_0]|nr:hypothetical protein [Spirulinaceae cyanobacterium SM2_1_0]